MQRSVRQEPTASELPSSFQHAPNTSTHAIFCPRSRPQQNPHGKTGEQTTHPPVGAMSSSTGGDLRWSNAATTCWSMYCGGFPTFYTHSAHSLHNWTNRRRLPLQTCSGPPRKKLTHLCRKFVGEIDPPESMQPCPLHDISTTNCCM
jgi:hypothetical protein